MVPNFVLELPIDAQAVRLYAVLLSYAGCEGDAFPSLRKIRERMNMVSDETVRRARRELVEIGLIEVEERQRDNGSQTSNLYTVYTDPSFIRVGGGGHTNGRGSLQLTRSPEGESREVESRRPPPEVPPTPVKVNGKVASTQEVQTACLVLAAFNDRTGSNPPFRSPDWLKKIVLRMREHPEFGWEDFDGVIARALENPWWTGNPSPSVIFGNGSLFEQVMVTTSVPKQRKRRYGTGVTAGEMGDLARQLREAGR
jgi:hypothetical protein